MSHHISVHIEPIGPSEGQLQDLSQRILAHPLVAESLIAGKYRLLSLKTADSGEKSDEDQLPSKYHATIYDYARQRTLLVEGMIGHDDRPAITDLAIQPLPSDAEFAAAVELLKQDPQLGPEIQKQNLAVYRPMPPFIESVAPTGQSERILAIGIQSGDRNGGHRIVGVNLANATVLHTPGNVAAPADSNCGPAAQIGDCSSGGNNMARVRIQQGATVLWEMIVVRPAGSSGTNGSGVELRNVQYRGKSVLYRANVPILNVQYDPDGVAAGCGPTYRDWQNSEHCFMAEGSDPVPGFRLCSSPARTILDTDNDNGNFKGVAIYVEGSEVVLVSVMQAGWYRYVSSWRFDVNGTIRPRFGFAAANNRCTCHAHHHHCYWRLDFDIVSPANNVVEEYNDPPLIAPKHWHKKRYEIRRTKDAAHKRKWRVSHTGTGEGYEIIPGAHDGQVDAYGVGDLWVLRYHGTNPPPTGEEDDGQGFTTTPALSMEHIDRFVNGELVENQDVVLWYGAHFFHDELHQGNISHIVGPELHPHNW